MAAGGHSLLEAGELTLPKMARVRGPVNTKMLLISGCHLSQSVVSYLSADSPDEDYSQDASKNFSKS
eukprot:scaffold192268_cov36-Cyclotella_meneghiniana.AAC.3